MQLSYSLDSATKLQHAALSRSATSKSDWLDKSIAAGLLAVLVFTALAHGAVEPWSLALFELAITGLVLLWGIKALFDRHLEVHVPTATLPMLAFLLLGLVQSVAFNDSTGTRWSLSLDVEGTRHAVTTLAFLTVSFLLAANFLVTKERLLLLANFLTGFGTLLAIFALIQYFTFDHRLYWLRSTPYPVFGPFVNHNHFAGYMAMLAPIPIGLMLTVVRGQARLIYGFAAAIMGAAAVVSGSRSGAISLIAALVFIAVLSRRSRGYKRPSRMFTLVPLVVVAGAILISVLWIGAIPVVERFGQAVDAMVHSEGPDLSRPKMWRDTLEIARRYPLLGTGLGSFATVYPTYAQTEELFGLNYAHNDYLQVFAEGGLVGGILAGVFIGIILMAIYRGLTASEPSVLRYVVSCRCRDLRYCHPEFVGHRSANSIECPALSCPCRGCVAAWKPGN